MSEFLIYDTLLKKVDVDSKKKVNISDIMSRIAVINKSTKGKKILSLIYAMYIHHEKIKGMNVKISEKSNNGWVKINANKIDEDLYRIYDILLSDLGIE